MSFFLRRLRNHSEAEDLTQEVFVRLAASGSDKNFSNLDGYVFQTAANLLRDRIRREKVRNEYRQGLDEADSFPNEPLDPDRIYAGRESLNQAVMALRELNERTRAIFILFRLENMKQRDIANMFGISVSAVEKHVARAIAHLACRLSEIK